MIEVVQQVAVGSKQALNMYKVYRWNGEQREYMGWLCRGPHAKFNPYREYTDTDKKAILKAINAYMADNGYPAVKRYGNHGLTADKVQELLGRIQPDDTDEDDDE